MSEPKLTNEEIEELRAELVAECGQSADTEHRIDALCDQAKSAPTRASGNVELREALGKMLWVAYWYWEGPCGSTPFRGDFEKAKDVYASIDPALLPERNNATQPTHWMPLPPAPSAPAKEKPHTEQRLERTLRLLSELHSAWVKCCPKTYGNEAQLDLNSRVADCIEYEGEDGPTQTQENA